MQAVAPSPATADVAVQADIVTPQTPAAEANLRLGRHHDQLQELISQLQGEKHVMDTFCTDRDREIKKEHQEDLEK